jgi:hypothetical protein
MTCYVVCMTYYVILAFLMRDRDGLGFDSESDLSLRLPRVNPFS